MLIEKSKLEKIHAAVSILWEVLRVVVAAVIMCLGCTVGAGIIDLLSAAASPFELAVMAFFAVSAMFEGIALAWFIMYFPRK